MIQYFVVYDNKYDSKSQRYGYSLDKLGIE